MIQIDDGSDGLRVMSFYERIVSRVDLSRVAWTIAIEVGVAASCGLRVGAPRFPYYCTIVVQ
jgi:hypothetical protein